jgi:hypothetical protein
MDGQLLALAAFTFVINVIGTLAYSVRIAGVRTGRIAVSLSLFSMLALASRTANVFQTPILAKRVERGVLAGAGAATADFRWLLGSAALATVVGALLTPTFQRLFTRAVAGFAVRRSLLGLLGRGLSRAGLAELRAAAVLPRPSTLAALRGQARPPAGVLLANMLGTAIWTVGVFAPLCAVRLNPGLRVTSSSLSGVVNGVATLLLFVVVDPYLSLLTDDVAEGRQGEPLLRRAVVWFLGTKLVGAVLAQALLVPAAWAIAAAADRI